MKMKLPDLSGKVIVIKSDQEEARKCYENSLKTKRSVFMVFERPPSADTVMTEATPDEDIPMAEGPEDTTPIEEAAPLQGNGGEPQGANVLERDIGGKTFKLGVCWVMNSRRRWQE